MEGNLLKVNSPYSVEVTASTQDHSLLSIRIPSAKLHYHRPEEISEFMSVLSLNESSISELSVSENSYSEGVIKKLFSLISSCQGLTKLDVQHIFPEWDDSIHLESLNAICSALERLHLLVRLDFSWNFLPSHTMEFLGEALSFTNKLRFLNLDFNRIGSFGAAILADSLIDLKLNVFSARGNNFSDEGVIHISSLFYHMKTLKKVNIANNNFSKAGLKVLYNALKVNKNLKFLDISENFFNEERSGMYIGDMIAQIKTLRFLDLSDCLLGNTECRNILKFLNSKDIEINLKYNQLDGKRLAKKLFDFVKQKKVKSIYISGNDLDYDGRIPRAVEDKRGQRRDRKYFKALISVKEKAQYFYFI